MFFGVRHDCLHELVWRQHGIAVGEVHGARGEAAVVLVDTLTSFEENDTAAEFGGAIGGDQAGDTSAYYNQICHPGLPRFEVSQSIRAARPKRRAIVQ